MLTKPSSPAGVLKLCIDMNISALALIGIAKGDKRGAEFIRKAAAAPSAEALLSELGTEPSEKAILDKINRQQALTLLDGIIVHARDAK